jgi:hypothetical protein
LSLVISTAIFSLVFPTAVFFLDLRYILVKLTMEHWFNVGWNAWNTYASKWRLKVGLVPGDDMPGENEHLWKYEDRGYT